MRNEEEIQADIDQTKQEIKDCDYIIENSTESIEIIEAENRKNKLNEMLKMLYDELFWGLLVTFGIKIVGISWL